MYPRIRSATLSQCLLIPAEPRLNPVSTLPCSRLSPALVPALPQPNPGSTLNSGVPALQPYIERLLQAFNSFVHPSNTGGWSTRLGSFLYSLTDQFARRLREESREDSLQAPEFRLSEADRAWFVETVRPSLFMALFSKSPQMVFSASWAMRSLAYISPAHIMPQLLEKVYPALETAIEAHQTHAALSALLAIARPLVCKNLYPQANVHIMPLLHLCLPGIDANDPVKTQLTLQFYMVRWACRRLIPTARYFPSVRAVAADLVPWRPGAPGTLASPRFCLCP